MTRLPSTRGFSRERRRGGHSGRATTAAAAIGLLIVLAATEASAQTVEAAELFKRGRKALEAGDNATACVALDASERLEKAVGTLLSLAQCEEGLGKLAAARGHLEEAADWADAKNDQLHRGAVARARLALLDKRVPRLTLRLAAGAPKDTRVVRDGIDLGQAAFGGEFPVDPGKHSIVLTAAEHAPATVDVVLAEGESKVVEVGPGPSLATAGTATRTEGARAVAPASPPAETSPDRSMSAQRAAGIIVGSAGVVAIGFGAYFGLNASSTWSRAKGDCNPGACGAGSAAQSERSDAQLSATASTIAFVAGAAALVGGGILIGVSTHAEATTRASTLRLVPIAGPSTGGLVLTGAFQ